MYKRIEVLCENNGVSISEMCSNLGISRGTLTDYKKGRTKSLSQKTVIKIADYFNVSLDYLQKGEKKEPAQSADQEVTELLEYYRIRPELKLLFSVTKNASPESIKRAAAIVEALEKEENSEE